LSRLRPADHGLSRPSRWATAAASPRPATPSLASLVREVQEETGVQVEPVALSGVYKNMRRGIIALVFRCRIVAGESQPTAEVEQIAWLSPDEVRELMDEAYATRLLDALHPGPAAIRAHDGLSLLPL
jgi:8-oxo-dGTP diphosphatase